MRLSSLLRDRRLAVAGSAFLLCLLAALWLYTRDVDQRVRLLGTGGQNAARTVILERTADEMNAVGEKRRGDRVALERRQRAAVEGEARGACRCQAADAWNAIGPHHFAAPLSCSF